jgi:hypothetical protein
MIRLPRDELAGCHRVRNSQLRECGRVVTISSVFAMILVRDLVAGRDEPIAGNYFCHDVFS